MIGDRSDTLAIAMAMVRHAGDRQAVLSENIANVDTPGFRARDVQTFEEVFATGEAARADIDATAPIKPNGNSVSLEQQVMHLAETRGQHEMGLGLWEKTLDLYRTALGRGR